MEDTIKGYSGLNRPEIDFDAYKELCVFIYKTELGDKEILESIGKYHDYEEFIEGQSFLRRLNINRCMEEPIKTKTKAKKYVTYSAHGHF